MPLSQTSVLLAHQEKDRVEFCAAVSPFLLNKICLNQMACPGDDRSNTQYFELKAVTCFP